VKAVWVWLAVGLTALPIGAGQSDTVIRAGTDEVLLDVVARDKKGAPVTNLRAEDLTLFDNGVERPIKSLRLIQGSGVLAAEEKRQALQTGTAPAEKPLNPLHEIRLVTLIFNRLDLNARQLARSAALDLLKNELPQNVYMGVLVLGENLEALQAFTNNRDLIRKAIERATSGKYDEFKSDSAQIQAQMQQLMGPNSGGDSMGEQLGNMSTGGGGSGAGGAPDSGLAADQAMAQMMYNTLLLTRTTELAQTGRAAIYGLLDAVRQQYRLPGRKSVLFFSSGFGVPQGMEETFKTVISTANRFNVTFYSIEATGLNTKALNQEAVSQLRDATSAARQNMSHRGNGSVTPAMAQATDTAINAGKANTQDTLANLAESTGGFLIANTNDFREPLRKVSEDIETYYEITYNPGIEKYDGSFRKVELRTSRNNVRLQSRAGYFALPASVVASGTVLAPYEYPVMQALDTKPLPKAFGFQAAGMHFRGPAASSLCDLLVDVPLASITVSEEKGSGHYQGDLAYVAMVKDAKGTVVRKFSKDVPVSALSSQVAELKTSHFIANEHFELEPGRYTLETGVLDRTNNSVSARKSVFFMPPVEAKLGISSVAMMRGLRGKSDSTTPEDPFLMADKVVTPTLSPVLKKSETDSMSFFVTIYPNQKETAKSVLVMEFSRDGQVMGSGSPALGAPDEQGRIQYVATVPTTKLEPGNYRIRFVVKQGAEMAEESATFTLE
jgi:VWFA-related protein